MSLLALQSAFRAWLPSRENSSPSLFGDSCAPGLRVYRNNYRSQLINCLEHSFPRVREWLGPEAFLSVCTGHVDSVAPGSWTIDAYALGLLPTLAKHYPSDPDVTELAWLEWALGEAFISRDEAAVSAEDLDSVDWDNAVLHFVNSATVRPAQTNAGQIWAALADRQLPPAAERLAPGCGRAPARGAPRAPRCGRSESHVPARHVRCWHCPGGGSARPGRPTPRTTRCRC